jgi:uncharacterized protein (TIGR02996 family)
VTRYERAVPSTDEALFAAVYAAPDSDGPRAVLADYLLEQGDPRGEFIALQLAKQKSHAGERREKQLLELYELPWLGPLGAVVMPSTTVWERGFLCSAQARLHGETVGDPRWATVQKLQLLAPEHARPLELTGGTMRSLLELTDATPTCLDVLLKGRPTRQRALKGFADGGGLQRPPLEHLGCRLDRTVRGWSKKQVDWLLKLAEFPHLRSLAIHLAPFWNALELDWLWRSRLARKLRQLSLTGLPPLDVAGSLAQARQLTSLHSFTLQHRTAAFHFRRAPSGSMSELQLEMLERHEPTIERTILQPLAALPPEALTRFVVTRSHPERIRKLGALRAVVSRFPKLLPIAW